MFHAVLSRDLTLRGTGAIRITVQKYCFFLKYARLVPQVVRICPVYCLLVTVYQ